MKRLIQIVLFLLPISIISFVVKYKTIFLNESIVEASNENIMVKITDKNIVIELEDYIIGVVSGEMPALFEEEALKAQAVAARSYLLSSISKEENIFEITSTINDQVFLTEEEMEEKWGKDFEYYYNKIRSCVLATKNLVLKNNDEILKTYYFAMSNGYTEDSQTVFGNNNFESVESIWDNETLKNFEVQTKIAEKDFSKLLNLSDEKIVINNIKKNKTARVENIVINDIGFSGTDFRKRLSLRSTDFTLKKEGSFFIVTTKGYGHGVGMSQYGANGMAKEGYNYQEILQHYYKNSKIEKN